MCTRPFLLLKGPGDEAMYCTDEPQQILLKFNGSVQANLIVGPVQKIPGVLFHNGLLRLLSGGGGEGYLL